MSRIRTYQFGAGSLEDMALNIWTARVNERKERLFNLRFFGTYRVYCGYGNEHTVTIDAKDGAWSVEKDTHARDISAARYGDWDAIDRLTASLMEWALEDWEDPCYEIDVHDEPTTGKFWVEYA